MNYYLCDQATHQVLQGPMSCQQVVDIIISKGTLDEQSKFCNMSRYMLAKRGRYPRTKAGDAAILRDIELHRDQLALFDEREAA